MSNDTTDILAKTAATGIPAYLVTSAATDAAFKKAGVNNPLSDAKNAILNSVESTQKGKAAIKTAGKAAGVVGDYLIDIGMGAYDISQNAQNMRMSAGEKGYTITGDVIGVAANIGVNVFTSTALSGAAAGGAAAGGAAAGGAAAGGAAAGGAAAGGAGATAGTTLAAGAATGPGIIIAVVIVLFQVLGGIIDAFADPFKNFFNRDLREMRDAYDKALKKTFIDMGLNWPIEIKPDLIGIIFSDEKNIDKYKSYISEYYKDNNLVTKKEFLDDWNLLLNLRKIRRNSKKYIIDNEGYVVGLKNSIDMTSEITSDVESNILIMFALAARISKYRKMTRQKPSVIKQFINEYYITIIISLFLLFSIIFLSIIIIL